MDRTQLGRKLGEDVTRFLWGRRRIAQCAYATPTFVFTELCYLMGKRPSIGDGFSFESKEMKNLAIVLFVALLAGGGLWLLAQPFLNVPDNDVPEEQSIEAELSRVLGMAEAAPSLRYNLTIDSPDGDIEAEFYEKGDLIRMEVETEGQLVVNLVDQASGKAYAFLPDHDAATRIGPDQIEEIRRGSIYQLLLSLNQQELRLIGREEFNGYDCLVVAYDQPEGRAMVWIWEERGWPVKFEIVDNGRLIRGRVRNIEQVDLSDDLFRLPEEIDILALAD